MDFLEAATNDELVGELARRFPALVVAGVRPAPEGADDESFLLTYHGGFTAALGLAVRAAAVLRRDAVRGVRDQDQGGT
jgi:hypothetical protein